MKKDLGSKFVLIGAIALLMPLVGRSQEFFRDLGTSRSSGGIGPVVPSDYTYEDGSPTGLRPLRPGQELTAVEQAEEEDKYNFAIGALRFSIAAGVGLEWNDNVFLSENRREDDFVFRPTLSIDSRWRITELNTLRFNLGMSYAKYFDHDELDSDGLLFSPNSELALTFYLGSVKFTARDRFSYQEDTYDIAPISNVATYKRYENQAGIEMDWQINQAFSLPVGYDHYNLWTKGDEFSEQDRAIDTIYTRPAIQFTPAIKVGLNAAYSFIDFDDEDRADGGNLLVGPFAEIQISEFTNLYLEGGFQNLDFQGGSDFNNATLNLLRIAEEDRALFQDEDFNDNSDLSTWYAKFEIQNKPSDFFRHRLSGAKTAEIGFGTNYYELYHVEYDAEWKFTERDELGPTLFYEYYKTSGDGGEKAHRFGAGLGIRHHFTNSLTLGLDYRFILKDSDQEDADYYQNLVFLSAYYKF